MPRSVNKIAKPKHGTSPCAARSAPTRQAVRRQRGFIFRSVNRKSVDRLYESMPGLAPSLQPPHDLVELIEIAIADRERPTTAAALIDADGETERVGQALFRSVRICIFGGAVGAPADR